MDKFNIEQFAAHLREVKAKATHKRTAVAHELARVIQTYGVEAIVEALDAAIPAGATPGEMIVHRDDELTLLYARVPPRFQSAIHDHTVCACIAQLTGEETSVVYEPTRDGAGLQVARTLTSRPGEVTTLPADAIHHIENPTDGVSKALHVYGGDFEAVKDKRSLWSHGDHERNGFSFEALLQQSVVAMKKSGNDKGLQGLVQAIPAARKLVEAP